MGDLVDASYFSHLISHAKSLGVQANMKGILAVVNDTLLNWLVLWFANRDFLRSQDGWRQAKKNRNEEAMWFQ